MDADLYLLFLLLLLTANAMGYLDRHSPRRPEREMESRILDLPKDVLDSAIRVGTECAWHTTRLPRAIEALRAAGLAIVGGEVWAIRFKSECIASEPTTKRDNLDPAKRRLGLVLFDDDEVVVYGGIPRHGLGPLEVFSWEVEPRREGEEWDAFVDRAAKETWEWVLATRVEHQVSPRFTRSLYYNVVLAGEGWATRSHWPRMQAG